MWLLSLLGCPLLGQYELDQALSASTPEEAEQHYVLGCGYGSVEACEGWLRALSGRSAGEAERLDALSILCRPSRLEDCTELGAIASRAGKPDLALAPLQMACDGESEEACGYLGRLLSRQEPDRARGLLQIASRDHPIFKPDLAALTEDPATAARLREEACAAGVPEGCAALGVGERPDFERDQMQECWFGEPRACKRMGALYESVGETEPWSPERFYWLHQGVCPAQTPECQRAEDEWFAPIAAQLQSACERPDPASCDALGRLVETGRGVDPNLGRAALLFKNACARGEAEACLRYGLALQEGRGVVRDRVMAVALFHESCEKGSPRGCELEAWSRYNGHGARQSPEAALELARRACGGGRCFLYASILAALRQSDPEQREDALREGCRSGEAESCRQLGSEKIRPPGTLQRSLEPEELDAMRLSAIGCADYDADACRSLSLLTSPAGPSRLASPEASEMAAQRACDLGLAAGCQLLGQRERACEMGLRWVCEDLASEGVRVMMPGARP